MRLFEEIKYDMDFKTPKVILSTDFVIVENVKSIVIISETSLTVQCDNVYVAINGTDFVLKEIFEGRLWLEGNIQGTEFLNPSGENKNRGVQNR